MAIHCLQKAFEKIIETQNESSGDNKTNNVTEEPISGKSGQRSSWCRYNDASAWTQLAACDVPGLRWQNGKEKDRIGSD